jgi:hypothetical protein
MRILRSTVRNVLFIPGENFARKILNLARISPRDIRPVVTKKLLTLMSSRRRRGKEIGAVAASDLAGAFASFIREAKLRSEGVIDPEGDVGGVLLRVVAAVIKLVSTGDENVALVCW